MEDSRPTLRNGDTIYLLNVYNNSTSYLDACPSSPTCQSINGVYSLQTSTTPNPEEGSSIWEIQSVDGGEGDPISYGDEIYLLNHYGKRSYLDTCGKSTCTTGKESKFLLQTGTSPLDSGTWVIIHKANGQGPVKDGDEIHLQQSDGTEDSYLDACGQSTCNGNDGVYSLQTSTNKNRDKGSGTWGIEITYPGK